MNKKLSRITAVIMLVICIVFFIIAINNPQAGFPWSNTVTYTIYGVYFTVMTILFIAPLKSEKK